MHRQASTTLAYVRHRNIHTHLYMYTYTYTITVCMLLMFACRLVRKHAINICITKETILTFFATMQAYQTHILGVVKVHIHTHVYATYINKYLLGSSAGGNVHQR